MNFSVGGTDVVVALTGYWYAIVTDWNVTVDLRNSYVVVYRLITWKVYGTERPLWSVLDIGWMRSLEHGLLVIGDFAVGCDSTGCVLFSLPMGRIRLSSKTLSPCAFKAHAPTDRDDRRIRTTGSGESILEAWRLSHPAVTPTARTVASSTRR